MPVQHGCLRMPASRRRLDVADVDGVDDRRVREHNFRSKLDLGSFILHTRLLAFDGSPLTAASSRAPTSRTCTSTSTSTRLTKSASPAKIFNRLVLDIYTHDL